MLRRKAEDKLLSREKAVQMCSEAQAIGQKVGFSSGAYDLLHAGHILSLEHAKIECDILVVGVNSDESVRKYKGVFRPIQAERQRALLVASLEAVDLVFLFDEVNTNESVAMLKPQVYIKGGDYTIGELSSAKIVEAQGGRVAITPFLSGVSTSIIIGEIVNRFKNAEPACIELPAPAERPVVFLDRDGTVIEHVDYLHDPERVKVFPGAFSALKRMRAAGARLVMVTNQPGIGTGFLSEDDFFRVNKRLMTEASAAGVVFDRIYYCPHSLGDGCSCRKPGTALIERAVRELNVDLSSSFVIGDMTSDVELGRAAGCRTILLRTGHAGTDRRYSSIPDFVVDDLEQAADLIEAEMATNGAKATQPFCQLRNPGVQEGAPAVMATNTKRNPR